MRLLFRQMQVSGRWRANAPAGMHSGDDRRADVIESPSGLDDALDIKVISANCVTGERPAGHSL